MCCLSALYKMLLLYVICIVCLLCAEVVMIYCAKVLHISSIYHICIRFWCTTTPYIVLKCQLIISRQALCLAETLLLTKFEFSSSRSQDDQLYAAGMRWEHDRLVNPEGIVLLSHRCHQTYLDGPGGTTGPACLAMPTILFQSGL